MDRTDEVDDARRLLGVAPGADRTSIQAAFRKRLLLTHPDVSDQRDATERTVRLTAAYRLLTAAAEVAEVADLAATPSPAPSSAPPPAGARTPEERPIPVAVALVDAETIGFAAPADETLFLLLDAANRLGEISYLDRSAGLLEVVIEFLDAPTSSVVLTLQGRASGVTEVTCSVEPLSGGAAPPADAVTRLLLDTLVDEPSSR